MSNWKIGQKLVMVENCPKSWDYPCPVKGDIVTFDGNEHYGLIYLAEYINLHPVHGFRFAINPCFFRPLQGESAKAELLSSFREVVEAPDCPINVPQTETS